MNTFAYIYSCCIYIGHIFDGQWLHSASIWYPKALVEISCFVFELRILGPTGKIYTKNAGYTYFQGSDRPLYVFSQGQNQNDLSGLVFDNVTPDLPKLSGDDLLVSIFQLNVHRSKWIDLSVIFSMIIIYRAIFFLIIKVNEDITPWIRAYIARRRLQHRTLVQNTHVASNVLDNHLP